MMTPERQPPLGKKCSWRPPRPRGTHDL